MVVPGDQLGEVMPFRPVPLVKTNIVLSRCHATSVDHALNTYRLYRVGPESKGVFRDGHLVCEHIPEENENRFCGLLIYSKQAYELAKRNHKQYWEWVRNRNQARWRAQEAGELDYDAKNMMHTVRLMLSGEHILTKGRPLVRVQGDKLDMLRAILSGKFSYDELMRFVEDKTRELIQLREKSSLPDLPDREMANALLWKLTQRWEDRNA